MAKAKASSGRFDCRLDRDTFTGGDTVEGTVVAREDVRARSLRIALRYVDESKDYREGTDADAALAHEGDVARGQQLAFRFRLPAEALPAHRSANGRLYWAVAVDVDVPRGRDVRELHELQVEAGPAAGRGAAEPPEPAAGTRNVGPLILGLVVGFAGLGVMIGALAAGATAAGVAIGAGTLAAVGLCALWAAARRRTGERWDVTLSPRAVEARRGADVSTDVGIGAPAPDRRIKVGLVCYEHYDVETTDSDGDTQRSTRLAVAHEEYRPLESSSSQQTVRFVVPAESPFSYRGDAVHYEWQLIATEDRKGFDPKRRAAVRVLP